MEPKKSPQDSGELWTPTMVELFWEAFRLLLLWMMIPLFILILVSVYKTSLLAEEGDGKSRSVATLELDQAMLYVNYPDAISFDYEEDKREPVSIWALYLTPTPGPSPTLSATSSQIETPTPVQYIVSIQESDSANSLSFTDDKGRNVPQQFIITPSNGNATPAVFYIQPNEVSTAQSELTIYAEDKDTKIVIGVDKRQYDQILLDYLVEPFAGTTFLIALAGFGFQQWQQYQKKKDESEQQILKDKEDEDKKKESLEKEKKEFAELIKGNLSEAARQYQEKVDKN